MTYGPGDNLCQHILVAAHQQQPILPNRQARKEYQKLSPKHGHLSTRYVLLRSCPCELETHLHGSKPQLEA